MSVTEASELVDIIGRATLPQEGRDNCADFITNMMLGTTNTGAASGAMLTQKLDGIHNYLTLGDWKPSPSTRGHFGLAS